MPNFPEEFGEEELHLKDEDKEEYEYARQFVGKKAVVLHKLLTDKDFEIISVHDKNDREGSVQGWNGKYESNYTIHWNYLREPSEIVNDLPEGKYFISDLRDGKNRNCDQVRIFKKIDEWSFQKNEPNSAIKTIIDKDIEQQLKISEEQFRKHVKDQKLTKIEIIGVFGLNDNAYMRRQSKTKLIDIAVDKQIGAICHELEMQKKTKSVNPHFKNKVLEIAVQSHKDTDFK
jgi:hypothetical protein